MKRVPVLEDEPAELAQWRAANPEDDASTGSNAKGAWDRFKSSGAYRPLVDRLMARQQGLCGYCEQRLYDDGRPLVVNDYQVEHVLAKSGGSGRVLDWQNFLLCCGGGTWKHQRDPTRYHPSPRGKTNVSCGQAKGDVDIDASCDPRSLPWHEPVVRVDIDGRMRPDEDACRRLGIDPEALFAASHLPADRLDVAFQLFVEGRLRPNQRGCLRRFWTTERVYLGAAAEAWIRENPGLLHFE
jgi:uncharacterized protein (TIGR02646 family)